MYRSVSATYARCDLLADGWVWYKGTRCKSPPPDGWTAVRSGKTSIDTGIVYRGQVNHNLAGDPDLAGIKEKLAAWIPTRNVMPKSLKNGELDSYGRKYQWLRDEGVPDWLGRIPPISTE